MEILATKRVSRNFGSLAAVHQVDFSVEKGELRSIIGPNGAGKTTLFNLLTGILPPTGGEIFFKNENITGLPPYAVAQKGIGRSFQITSIFPELTVYENILIPCMLYDHPRSEAVKRTWEILEEIDLKGKADSIAANLSHGDKRHLDIGIAMTTRPELLLLDEPTSGMPPEESIRTVKLIQKLRSEKGYTIILIEHKMDIVLSVSDRVTVLHLGEKLAEGTPSEIQANEQVQRAYLGGLDKEYNFVSRRQTSGQNAKEVLVLEKVNAFYGESHVLHDISLKVTEGEIVALLGRNGAGKTTTLRAVMGLTPARSGMIRFQDQRIETLAPETIADMGIGLVPAERRIFANLTLLENLELPFFMKGISSLKRRCQVEAFFNDFPTLINRKAHKGNRLSGGEQQMLAIGRALMGRIRFMMLDEPSQGLAPLIVKHLAEVIQKINREGITILLVEQNALMALELSDRVYVMDKGAMVYEGKPDQLWASRQLRQQLLGV